MVRDDVTSALGGALLIGNSVLRVMSDTNAGLAHLILRYIDWLARQFLPDTAETEWLDRHGDIWLVNADNSVGRKNATLASGSVTLTGTLGTIVPRGVQLQGNDVLYETMEQITIGSVATPASVIAVDAGIAGNLAADETLSLNDAILGVDGIATVVVLEGGTDAETDEQLRSRVLFRIQEPPMGGDANDYVAWALAVPGVTRAWASQEMGVGCVTVRVMMDILRATSSPTTNGFPLTNDLTTVKAYLDQKRPVTVKDLFVQSPVPEPISFTISNLSKDDASVRAAIAVSVDEMLREKAAPAYTINGVLQSAQTIYSAWVSEAISNTAGVDHFDLTMADHVMPNNGYMGVLGTITFV